LTQETVAPPNGRIAAAKPPLERGCADAVRSTLPAV
jgi:hypothetical protein